MIYNQNVQMGQLPEMWNGGIAQSITFCVTEDCNLSCKYCYMTGKNKKKRMNFYTAKKAVDMILSDRKFFSGKAVIWEFIGGEPFLEIDLIDEISYYIKQQMYLLKHPWFNNYIFNFSSNGLLYGTPKVQEYIRKNKYHISIGISVDGNKTKHDLQRIKTDGTGSYDDVVKNVPLWLEQFPASSTKSTFSHDDLPHLKDSIINLWELGIKNIAANVIFEDVWHENDDIIFESQLKELADYVLEKELWKDYSVRFFDPSMGFPLRPEQIEVNYCGSGKMLAIDCEGNFFPCVRFIDFSLSNRKGVCIGDINNGIDYDKLRPFVNLSLKTQSTKECIECDIASGCAWCTAFNYDTADTDTIYQRATFICKMHKANVRANKYFWDKFSQVTGLVSEREKLNQLHLSEGKSPVKFLQFITSDNITPHCCYKNWRSTNNVMDESTVKDGLKYAQANGFTPIFLGNSPVSTPIEHMSILDSNSITDTQTSNIAVYNNDVNDITINVPNCILLISKHNIRRVFDFVKKLLSSDCRVNLILQDIEEWEQKDINLYSEQLDFLVDYIFNSYKQGKSLELNVLTDIFDLNCMDNCDAGNTTFTLAPNRKFYICPAFYFNDTDSYIGSLDEGINVKNAHLLEIESSPICSNCDVYSCQRCKFLNKKLTNEFNTPSRIQCIINHIQRNKAKDLQTLLDEANILTTKNILKKIDYIDPLEKIANQNWRNIINAQ